MKISFGFKSEKSLVTTILVTKFFYVFFAYFVYSKLTRLGDTSRYLNSGFSWDLSVFYSSTKLMEFTGSLFGLLPQPLSYIPAAILSTFGMLYFLKVLHVSGFICGYWGRVRFFIIVSLPSVAVWTSIHSKEAVGFFFSSICAAFLVKIYVGTVKYKKKDWLLLIVSVYLMAVFKPQYCIAFFSISFFVLITKNITPQLMALLLAVILICQVFILVEIQPVVDHYALQMYHHFESETAQSTRDNIFLEEGDFYRNIVPGIFVAFWGATLSEASTSIPKALSFVESFILVLMFSTCILKLFLDLLVHLKLNVIHISIICLFVFWLLLMHYPFGIFNPGSAIRYRNNFVPFLMVAMYLIEYSKSSKAKVCN